MGPVSTLESYSTADIPLFVRGCGPLPLKTLASVADVFPDPLVWAVWPGAGAAGSFTLYEDDGVLVRHGSELSCVISCFLSCWSLLQKRRVHWRGVRVYTCSGVVYASERNPRGIADSFVWGAAPGVSGGSWACSAGM